MEDSEEKEFEKKAENRKKPEDVKKEMEKLSVGDRVLVRTEGTAQSPCLIEGRLDKISTDSKGVTEIEVLAPLTGEDPTRRVFEFKGNDTEEYLVPPKDISEHDAAMEVGARIIGPFPDASVPGRWAWYEGDVIHFRDNKMVVRYVDGVEWGHLYKTNRQMLDIKCSEMWLSREVLEGSFRNQMSVWTLPVICIRPSEKALKKIECERKDRPEWKVEVTQLKKGCRVLVRTEGSNSTPCLLEGRLEKIDEDEKGLPRIEVVAPLSGNSKEKKMFKFKGKSCREYMIPPERMEVYDKTMGVGAEVIGPFPDDDVPGRWAWYEGRVIACQDDEIKVRYIDGVTWNHTYKSNRQMLNIDHSEMWLNIEVLNSFKSEQAVKVLPLICTKPSRLIELEHLSAGIKLKSEIEDEKLLLAGLRSLKQGMRICVRTRGTNDMPCLIEGRLKEVKLKEKKIVVEAPLTEKSMLYRFDYCGRDTKNYLIPPEDVKFYDEMMGVGARVIGPFPDRGVPGGWGWYEGDVIVMEDNEVRVRYIDGICWEHVLKASRNMLDISKSEKLLTRSALEKYGSQDKTMPIICIRPPRISELRLLITQRALNRDLPEYLRMLFPTVLYASCGSVTKKSKRKAYKRETKGEHKKVSERRDLKENSKNDNSQNKY